MMQLLPKGGGDETSPARPSAGHVNRRAGSHRFFRGGRTPTRSVSEEVTISVSESIYARLKSMENSLADAAGWYASVLPG